MGGESAMAYQMKAQNVFNTAQAQQQSAIDDEVSLMNAEADRVLQDASFESARIGEEGAHFAATQENEFANTGFTLEGTPVVFLSDTRRKIARERAALESRAKLEFGVLRRKSHILGVTGRTNLVTDRNRFTSEQAQSKIANRASGASLLSSVLGNLSNIFVSSMLFPAKSKLPTSSKSPPGLYQPLSSNANFGSLIP